MTDGQTDGRTNGRTDRWTDKVITIGPPPTSSGGTLMRDLLRFNVYKTVILYSQNRFSVIKS